MNRRLEGTVALVTGASSGIGHATALELAREGASVAGELVGRREERLTDLAAEITGAGGKALVVPADITTAQAAAEAVERTVEGLGRLDTLVNNAGLMLLGPAPSADLNDWRRMIDINLMGLMYTAHAAVPHLVKAAAEEPRQVADIVNIGSLAGRNAYAMSAVYSATKFGVGAFSEALRQGTGTPARPRVRSRAGQRSTPNWCATTPTSSSSTSSPPWATSSGCRPGHRRHRRLHRHPPGTWPSPSCSYAPPSRPERPSRGQLRSTHGVVMAMRRILAVATNQATYGTDPHRTGLWIGELVHFHAGVRQAGFEVAPQGRASSGSSASAVAGCPAGQFVHRPDVTGIVLGPGPSVRWDVHSEAVALSSSGQRASMARAAAVQSGHSSR